MLKNNNGTKRLKSMSNIYIMLIMFMMMIEAQLKIWRMKSGKPCLTCSLVFPQFRKSWILIKNLVPTVNAGFRPVCPEGGYSAPTAQTLVGTFQGLSFSSIFPFDIGASSWDTELVKKYLISFPHFCSG